jgi:hypothetical protein
MKIQNYVAIKILAIGLLSAAILPGNAVAQGFFRNGGDGGAGGNSGAKGNGGIDGLANPSGANMTEGSMTGIEGGIPVANMT